MVDVADIASWLAGKIVGSNATLIDDATELHQLNLIWEQLLPKLSYLFTADQKTARLKILQENIKFVNMFNNMESKSQLKVTIFSLFSQDEMALYVGGSDVFPEFEDDTEFDDIDTDLTSNLFQEKYFDWRDFGVVGPIRNQGSCGSCWVFSAIASIESKMVIEHQVLFQLSPQSVLSCFDSPTQGCKGGNFAKVFKSYSTSHSLLTEGKFKYRQTDSVQCPVQASGVIRTTGMSNIHKISNDRLVSAVRRQPVSVAIDASSKCFQFYSHGILSQDSCSSVSHRINHAVVIVGFHNVGSTDKSNPPYWIVRNSWGKHWGAHGYVYIEFDSFLINSQVSYPEHAHFSPECIESEQSLFDCKMLGKFVNTSSLHNLHESSGMQRVVIIGVLFCGWFALVLYSLLSIVRRRWCPSKEHLDSRILLDHDYDSLILNDF